MPRMWIIRAAGGGDASYLNGLRIEQDGPTYYLETAPPNSRRIVGSSGNPPTFSNFYLDGSQWSWTLVINSLLPNPSGSWNNSDGAARLRDEVGSWSSEAVPEPLAEEAAC